MGFWFSWKRKCTNNVNRRFSKPPRLVFVRRSKRLPFPVPGSDKNEARGTRLSRSKIAREVLENLFSVFPVDSHTVADHLLNGGVPALAGQSGRRNDHT